MAERRDDPASRTARLATALIARHELARAVRVLNDAGVIPMPLKGVLLQHTVYRDPSDRMISDVDLLLPRGRLPVAREAFRAAGFAVGVEAQSGSPVRAPGGSLEVDLHPRPFPALLYRLSGAQMFARGRIDEGFVDGVVVVPSPLDAFAHAVGNFAKGRHSGQDTTQLRDFAAILSRFALPPGAVARHLEAHGLARAARYALEWTTGEPRDDEARAKVVAALRRDPIGAAAAAAARRIVARQGSGALSSAVCPHLTNRSAAAGALSALVHVAVGQRARAGRRRSERRRARRRRDDLKSAG